LKASPRLSISRDEIRAIDAQGEEAVIELVESLVARINALEERVEALEDVLKVKQMVKKLTQCKLRI
jgi:hypothetical protein